MSVEGCRHAYLLLESGADHVEIETYGSSLQLGREAMIRLGHRAHRAHRAAALFRMHDQALFQRNRPDKADDSGFYQATVSAVEALTTLLEGDREKERAHRGHDRQWCTSALYHGLTSEGAPKAQPEGRH